MCQNRELYAIVRQPPPGRLRRPPSPSGRDGASGEETVSPHAHSLRNTLTATATRLVLPMRARCSYPSPEGQGHRIWIFWSPFRGLGQCGTWWLLPRHRIGSGTDQNRNANSCCARSMHSAPSTLLRRGFFHMRFPCPTRGEGVREQAARLSIVRRGFKTPPVSA